MSAVSPRAAGADLADIEAVYRSRLAELQRVATAITGSREAGRDVVQDAFARAVHRRAEFRREGSVEGWIWRIVVTCARDWVQRLATKPTLPLEEGEESWHSSETRPGADRELRQLVARLPERQRLVLFLRYYADLDYGTIGHALQITGGTVGATLSQARDALLELMTEVRK